MDRLMWRVHAGLTAAYMVVGSLLSSKALWLYGSVFAFFAWLYRRRFRQAVIERVSRELEGRTPTKGFSK